MQNNSTNSKANLILFNIIMLTMTTISCNNVEKGKSSDMKVLEGKVYHLESSLCPVDIQVINNLIILEESGDSYFYHAYNKESLKFIGKFAKNGRGPFEYLSPSMMYQAVEEDDSTYIYISDSRINRIDRVNVLDALSISNFQPQTTNTLRTKLREASSIISAVMTKDNYVVGTAKFNQKKGRFFCYDIKNDIISWEPYYPPVKIKPHENMIEELYAGKLALKPNGNEIAVAAKYFKRIDILDTRAKLLRSIVLNNQNDEPDFSSHQRVPPAKSFTYFVSISVSDKFIYALDYELNNVTNDSIFDFYSPRNSLKPILLYKIDWEGKYIHEYKLIPRVYYISVDEQNQKIYGLQICNDSIVVFDLKRID